MISTAASIRTRARTSSPITLSAAGTAPSAHARERNAPVTMNVRSMGSSALAFQDSAWQIKLADKRGLAPDPDIISTKQLIAIDGENAALRFWIALGAGAIDSKVKMSVTDKAGAVLASRELTERTTCPRGVCAEENEPAVRHNLRSLAAGITEFIANPADHEKRQDSR